MEVLQNKNNSLVPYSDTESDNTCSGELENEIYVGTRGYKKKKKLPKRLQGKKLRINEVKSNPCVGKKCGNKCCEKFSEQDQLALNEHFWGLGNKYRQRDWLLSCMTRKCVQRRTSDSLKKQWSYAYFITYNEKHFKVCQQFLLKTLNISQNTLVHIRNKHSTINTSYLTRKRPPPHNKSDERKVALLKSFIEHLPAVPSHYCGNKSTKLYLPQYFRNVPTLYKCYNEYLKNTKQELSKLSLRVFRTIFKNEYHIGFHLPKKDKCIVCEKYKHSDREAQNILEQTEEYKMHIRDRDKSKEIFLEDQRKSKESGTYMCASFDLQKVLNMPHGKSVNLFYSRKYAFYNESVYENGTRNGYCFLWGESDGKRGCSEICSAIFQYLNILDERGTNSAIGLYCDSCVGENRNRAMLAMIIYFLEKAACIKHIKLTYLLPGHTIMPVDSIHSTIESFIRDRNVLASSEWYTIISSARSTPENYTCISIHNSDFKDWKTFSQALLPASVKISFTTLRSASFEKNSPVIKLHYGYFDDSKLKIYDLSTILRSRRNSRILSSGPATLYDRFLHISSSKYNDLKVLCEKNIIPKQFHSDYINLPHTGEIIDTLPETDEDD